MDKMTSLTCGQCGREIIIETEMTEGFCLYCGTKFEVARASEDKLLLSHAEALYEKEDWEALLEYAKDSKQEEFAAYAAAAKLHVTVNQYIRAAKNLAQNSPKHSILQFLTGRSTFGDSPIHSVFFCDLEKASENLAARLQDAAVNAEIREKIASDMVRFLLLTSCSNQEMYYWSLVASQQHAAPLLRFMPLDALTEVYQAFNKSYPNNESLPNQMKLKKEIEQRITDLGGTLPQKHKWF